MVSMLFGNVGALVREVKGQQFLVEAMRALQTDEGVHCLTCGEGRDRASLERQADGMSNLEFLGFQSESELWQSIT